MTSEIPPETSVTIVGAGPTGLTLGCLLQGLQVQTTILERRQHMSTFPKGRTLLPRSVEILKQNALIAAESGKVLRNGTDGTTFSGDSLTDPTASVKKYRTAPRPDTLEKRIHYISTGLEEELSTQYQQLGGAVFFDCDVTNVYEHHNYTETRYIHHQQTGMQRSQLLVAADGARSTVRDNIGLALATLDVREEIESIFFRAELPAAIMKDRYALTYSLKGGSSVVSVNNTDLWILMRPARESEHKTQKDAITSALGNANIPQQLLATRRWNPTVSLAHEFRYGKIFLAGDAAHTVYPTAGLGVNLGIHDAHNLAWRIKHSLADRSAHKYLDGYSPERRTIAARTCEHSIDLATAGRKRSNPLITCDYSYQSTDAYEGELNSLAVGKRFPLLSFGFDKSSDLHRYGQWSIIDYETASLPHPRLLDCVHFSAEPTEWNRSPKTGTRAVVRPDGFVVAIAGNYMNERTSCARDWLDLTR